MIWKRRVYSVVSHLHVRVWFSYHSQAFKEHLRNRGRINKTLREEVRIKAATVLTLLSILKLLPIMASVWGQLRSITHGRLCYYNRDEKEPEGVLMVANGRRWLGVHCGPQSKAFLVFCWVQLVGRDWQWLSLSKNSNELSFLLCLCFPIII